MYNTLFLHDGEVMACGILLVRGTFLLEIKAEHSFLFVFLFATDFHKTILHSHKRVVSFLIKLIMKFKTTYFLFNDLNLFKSKKKKNKKYT